MLQVFKEAIHGASTIYAIAKALKKSNNRVSEIVQELESEGFLERKKSYGLTGARLKIGISNTAYASFLRILMYSNQAINFEEILADSKLQFLCAICDDWITLNEASKLCKVSIPMILTYNKKLQDRGVIIKIKDLHKLNTKSWHGLRDFLLSYRNYSDIIGIVKWKFNDEILFMVDKEELLNGTQTGLHEYRNFGVTVYVISALCTLPKRKLTKEEIFVHSLFEVDDPRTLHLAMTFYLKNKLKYSKVLPIAMKYGKYTIFTNMVKLFNTKDKKIRLEGLPMFDRVDFMRILDIYEVKNV